MRIVVVDDNPDDRLLAERALRQAFPQAAVVQAGEPQSLARALEADAYDVLVTDYALRWSNGLEVLERSKARRPDVPVILFTNTGSEEVAAEALRKGASDYVIKRHGQHQRLAAAVQAALERAALQRKVEALHAEERKARLEAERASRLREEFLATLSHELRTPLHAILSWVHLLKAGVVKPDEQARAYEVIERNAKAQARLIEDLLDLSRMEAGKLSLELRLVPIERVIDDALAALQPAAHAKRVQIVRPADGGAGEVRADPARLRQVLLNLIGNAIKFSGEGGRVEIVSRQAASQVEVSVRDEGAGIAAEFLPHVFERFRQQDATTTRRAGGMGIGLAIAKSLVEAHGGTIRAESAGPGRGAAFSFRLPVPALQEPFDGSPSPDAPPPSLSGIRVLVVDDEPDALLVMRRTLELAGAQVTTAQNAREAFDAYSRATPDVIVTDIGMPGEDGYSFARRVRESGKPDAPVPIVALTAFARSEDRQRSLQAGLNAHLGKPVDPRELILCVARLAQTTIALSRSS